MSKPSATMSRRVQLTAYGAIGMNLVLLAALRIINLSSTKIKVNLADPGCTKTERAHLLRSNRYREGLGDLPNICSELRVAGPDQ